LSACTVVVVTGNGRSVNRLALGPQHGVHGVIAEPLLHGSRELPQLGIDRGVGHHATPSAAVTEPQPTQSIAISPRRPIPRQSSKDDPTLPAAPIWREA
jgi:hypothetical protein